MARRVDAEDPEDGDKTPEPPPAEQRRSLLLSRRLVLSFLALGVLVLLASLAFTIVSSRRPDPDPDEGWNMVRRSDWKAGPPTSVSPLRTAAQHVVVGQTETAGCATRAECLAMVRSVQQRDLRRGFSDIVTNFLVGGDGAVYEGRGWGVHSPHSHVRVRPSLGVSLVGSFALERPSSQQLDALRQLIRVGVKFGYVAPNYTLRADLDTADSNQLLAELTTWPHWSTGS